MTPAEIKRFVLAGRAVFTIDNGSGRHFTFKIDKGNEPEAGSRYRTAPYFAAVLEGPEQYSYMGLLNEQRGTLSQTKGSKVTARAMSWTALSWALRLIWSGKMLPAPAAFLHAGRCGRCGRELTDTLSVKTGIGPDCAEAMGIDRGRLLDEVEAREVGQEG